MISVFAEKSKFHGTVFGRIHVEKILMPSAQSKKKITLSGVCTLDPPLSPSPSLAFSTTVFTLFTLPRCDPSKMG